MQERTHRHGHILDRVIYRDNDNLSSMLSGNFFVNINVSLQKQYVSGKGISYRKYKSIGKEAFLAVLRVSSLVLDPPDDVDHLVDEHAPIRTKDMPKRPTLQWHNKNIQAEKRHRRFYERLLIRISLRVYYKIFKASKILVKYTLASAKSEYYNKNIQAAKRHRRYCERLWIRTSL